MDEFEDVMDELLNVVASGIGGLTNPSKIENTFRSVKHIKWMSGLCPRAQGMASLLKIDASFRKVIITEDLIEHHLDENGVEWVNVYDFLNSDAL